MDLLGKVIRNLLKQSRSEAIRNASSLAKGLRDEGMTDSQVEEMLFDSNFEQDIVSAALESMPKKAICKTPDQKANLP